ncbi:MAG TPA: acetate kinase [Chloroflexi bacterium]|nr:acetate kinase [Chloroflexota bacterium]
MKTLVINAGSSSIKYQLFEMENNAVLAAGLVERIGEAVGRVKHSVNTGPEKQEIARDQTIKDHRQGLLLVVDLLTDADFGVIASPTEIKAIGHRVVHGGEKFSQPTVITAEVRATIKALIPLAPLHNPANLTGIEVATEVFPEAVQVAVFDTAFHQTMPALAYRYAIPQNLYDEQRIRSYGFHGTSHLYVSRKAIEHLGKPAEETKIITLHLGNGASVAAVKGGQSIDSSMGFSPLPGLMMGTRSGDIDPAIVFYLGRNLGMTFDQIDALLNKKSGLMGICGDNDLRDIHKRVTAGDAAATLALEMYTYRIKKYIGAYVAALGGLDALVFTAGVGEKDEIVRALACQNLAYLGIQLDAEKNQRGATGPVTEIQSAESRVKVLVIPTNEELEIAQQTLGVIQSIEQN